MQANEAPVDDVDPGAVEAHHASMSDRVARQRDLFTAAHSRLSGAVQIDSIVLAVFIAIVLTQAGNAEFAAMAEALASLGASCVMASVVCAAVGLVSQDLFIYPESPASDAAARSMNRGAYLQWASTEMMRAEEANAAAVAAKGRWGTAALVLAIAGVAFAGITTISVIAA